jgi:uncharacterized protein (TIGR00725 family)
MGPNRRIQRVTVFGGARTSDADYQQALQLGRLLGEAGYTVLTGGYIGSMEAVSRGAAEKGAHVIGVTCDEIENWRKFGPNAWVQEEMRFKTLNERLYALIENCDAALALPGGPGTLAEIALMWNKLITGALPPRPLILIGEGWQATFNQFFATLGVFTPQEQRRFLSFVPDIQNAVRKLQADF